MPGQKEMPVRRNCRQRGPILVFLCLGTATIAANLTALPRKAPPAARNDETYPGVGVLYDAIEDAAGHRLRLIVTHPQTERTTFPVIFVAGWLSCDSVEAPPGSTDAPLLVFCALARLPGFVTVRMDKPGVGDSEGDCAATDFREELTAYQSAFRKLKDYPFADNSRIFIFGLSNGGAFAPMVAAGAAVRGYVITGGWIKTWFEHMLEIERRRLSLAGRTPAEIGRDMVSIEELYGAYLLEHRTPRQIFATRSDLKNLWEGDPDHHYGRPVTYYQQLQELNLMAAWSAVKVPLLALHGEFDWIMSRSDLQIMVELVNHNAPNAAHFMELPKTGHTFEHYASQEAAFAGKPLPFDDHIASLIGEWLTAHR